jgi:hypothetical protein
LIWLSTFASRLESWNSLRQRCQNLPAQSALENINALVVWRTVASLLSTLGRSRTWPDPWQLLSDDIYCELARGLGILYTITLLDRADLAPARLGFDPFWTNLVLVGKEKYILNWEPNTVVNTILRSKNPTAVPATPNSIAAKTI